LGKDEKRNRRQPLISERTRNVWRRQPGNQNLVTRRGRQEEKDEQPNVPFNVTRGAMDGTEPGR